MICTGPRRWQDGSDAIADWPILNAMLNVASRRRRGSRVHHGGGVGIGRSIHSGAQVVADGTDDGALRLERVLHQRPRHRRHAPRARRLRQSATATTRARPASTSPGSTHDVPRCPDAVLDGDGLRRDVARRARRDRDRPRAAGRRTCRRAREVERLTAPAAHARPGQRALARLPARPARPRRARRPRGRRTTTSGPGARRCTPWSSRSTRSALPRRRAALPSRKMRGEGITAVGEFHYVHHQPDGTPYDARNVLAEAVVHAAREEGHPHCAAS